MSSDKVFTKFELDEKAVKSKPFYWVLSALVPQSISLLANISIPDTIFIDPITSNNQITLKRISCLRFMHFILKHNWKECFNFYVFRKNKKMDLHG
jgi:hypothetical protein